MQVTSGLWQVGVLNPSLRLFDIIMETRFGTSYNAWLLRGSEKTALIETTHEDWSEDFFENIEEVCPVSSIDYLVMNHTEPDHSGSVRRLLERNPNLTIYGTAATIKNLGAITGLSFQSVAVKHGQTLDLGGRTLSFIIAPNLHWPDSMMTYVPEEKTLFTCDFLGAHFCEPRMLADQTSDREGYESAFRFYYDCIFGPFKTFVRQGLDKLQGLDIDRVCPSHGPMLRGADIAWAMDRYREWSAPLCEANEPLPVLYTSAYGFTRGMAEYLCGALRERGVEAACYDMTKHPAAELAGRASRAGAFVLGTPTINRAAVPPAWNFIAHIDAIACRGKPAAVFGSYGWSGEGCAQMESALSSLGIKLVSPAVRAVFRMTEETRAQLDALAQTLAESIQ